MLQSKDNDIKMNQVSPRLKDIIREADRKCNETRGVYDYILAELIIKECARIADMVSENKVEWVGGNILVYFGLKE